ncbi:FAS1-like dehydratase domain-containing protein [Novosphingobium lindaniclasticum]|uniref:FAS1-like dehydratase domain-containing protein n=1 Tax=Novosphingobium lindaniclasticum LE124 TaxID=1096930 RepID=T0IXG1_9SPHN|nr:MaoC family dehydratase N-terminal domain-containing protein [Novosphingobium lindaniclasticum]EQB14329.1 hypothetical protein L284_13110 [Novosphingobium lindaniclasticum LE124]
MGDISAWIGSKMTRSDRLDVARVNALLVALGDDPIANGSILPPLYHWLHFWDVSAPDHTGHDGHPQKGGFLPPIELPRRMWAGGSLRFIRPLRLGQAISRSSQITDISHKEGKSGKLAFVKVHHEISDDHGVAIEEQQDIVYREAARQTSPLPIGGDLPSAPWQNDIVPDPVLLFRFSALTMNSHRIHYDRPYALAEETYPALVVQGPLQAILLMRLAARNLSTPVTAFEFRGLSPAFDTIMLHTCGEAHGAGAKLWNRQGNTMTMSASASTE